MPKVSIVIPIYNKWMMTHSQLWDLYRKEKENIDYILVMDDCSPDEEVHSGIKWWKENNLLPLGVLSNHLNLGFLLSSNKGLDVAGVKLSPDDIIILLSSDVLIHGKFISQIETILGGNPKSLVGGKLLNYDTGWNKFGDALFPYIEGWLLAMTVAGWRELDYFDEQFAPCDFEDVDISTKAIQKGYELVPLNNVGIVHMGAQSIGYNDKRMAQTLINKEKFKNKWIR